MATPNAQPLPEEITSSLAAVWKRYTKKHPVNATTEIRGNVVRCVLPASVSDFETAMEGEEEAPDPGARILTYRREATAAVARTTRCRVLAFVSDHDAKTDIATEKFVLDLPAKQASFGEPGWIAR
jgi:hypothetical protein